MSEQPGELFDLAMALEGAERRGFLELLARHDPAGARRLEAQLAEFTAFADMMDNARALADMMTHLGNEPSETSPHPPADAPPDDTAAAPRPEPAVPRRASRLGAAARYLCAGLVGVLCTYLALGRGAAVPEATLPPHVATLPDAYRLTAPADALPTPSDTAGHSAAQCLDHGRDAFLQGRYAEATRWWQAAKDRPDAGSAAPEAARLLALAEEARAKTSWLDATRLQWHLPRPEQAAAPLTALGAETLQTASLLVQYGLVLAASARHEQAEEVLARAEIMADYVAGSEGRRSYLPVLRAESLTALQRYEAAETLLLQCLARVPPQSEDSVLVRAALVRHYRARGDSGRAEAFSRNP